MPEIYSKKKKKKKTQQFSISNLESLLKMFMFFT